MSADASHMDLSSVWQVVLVGRCLRWMRLRRQAKGVAAADLCALIDHA